MRRQCENCGNYLNETDRACPVCGIPASFPEDKVKAASDEFASLVRSSNPSVKRQRYVTLSTVVIAVLSIALLLVTLSTCLGGSKLCSKPMNYNKDLGYYNYNNTVYYNQGGNWYEYDPALGWILADPSDDFLDHYDNYYEGQINNVDRTIRNTAIWIPTWMMIGKKSHYANREISVIIVLSEF